MQSIFPLIDLENCELALYLSHRIEKIGSAEMFSKYNQAMFYEMDDVPGTD